jgi:hypothetical protein
MATGQTWGYVYVNNQNYKFDLPLCMEFDLVEMIDSPRVRFKGDTSSQAHGLSNFGTGHYKWVITKTDIQLTVDGVNKPLSLNLARENGLGIYWEFDSDTDGLTYKNFVVYPI